MNIGIENNKLVEKLTNFNTNVGDLERLISTVAGSALVTYGLKRRDVTGVLLSVLGGGLALRGATGHCQLYDAVGIDTSNKSEGTEADSKNVKSPYNKGKFSGKVHVTKSVTINKSQAELYQFWRNFENLSQFMSHLESVKRIDNKLSHWKAKAPLGYSVEWDAEVTSEKENERIGWQSKEGSDIANSGVVEFLPTSNRGTQVRVTLTYEAPAGKLGSLIAKLFGEEPSQQVADDLRHFKQLMESGTIMTIEGQPSGRKAKSASA